MSSGEVLGSVDTRATLYMFLSRGILKGARCLEERGTSTTLFETTNTIFDEAGIVIVEYPRAWVEVLA